ncbi:hypothetical protein WT61_19855 [Burkholderia stagnalis]|nr:hypothetical protein WT61_19855 [Burkholderia stagnalis]
MVTRRLPSKSALPTRLFPMHPLPTSTWRKRPLSKRPLSTRIFLKPLPPIRTQPKRLRSTCL